jgi:hypothetical protein
MDQKVVFDVNGLPIIETTYKGREGMRHEQEQEQADEATDGTEDSCT